jgi:hypothetical protein
MSDKTLKSQTSIDAMNKPKTGKANLLTSINHFLIDNVGSGVVHNGTLTALPAGKSHWWFFGYPLAALLFPSISVTDVGLFTPGERAFDRLLGTDADGNWIKGTRNQTLIEINCWAKDTAETANAEQVVRELRDLVMYALLNAGDSKADESGLAVPSILLKDYYDDMTPTVGVIYVDRASNAINEKFIVDQADQQIKRYRILARIFWDEIA